MESFEEWLKTTQFAKDYHGTDDDMPEAFDDWLALLDIHEWLEYGQEFAQDYADIKSRK